MKQKKGIVLAVIGIVCIILSQAGIFKMEIRQGLGLYEEMTYITYPLLGVGLLLLIIGAYQFARDSSDSVKVMLPIAFILGLGESCTPQPNTTEQKENIALMPESESESTVEQYESEPMEQDEITPVETEEKEVFDVPQRQKSDYIGTWDDQGFTLEITATNSELMNIRCIQGFWAPEYVNATFRYVDGKIEFYDSIFEQESYFIIEEDGRLKQSVGAYDFQYYEKI